jgi:predicted transcriptional regulator
MKKKTSTTFWWKGQKKEALVINLKWATKKEKENARKLYKSISNRLNEKRREENKDLIVKYQELYKKKKLDEKTFQKWLKIFKELKSDFNEDDFRKIIFWKSESSEQLIWI